jgi:hypothetical protein
VSEEEKEKVGAKESKKKRRRLKGTRGREREIRAGDEIGEGQEERGKVEQTGTKGWPCLKTTLLSEVKKRGDRLAKLGK